MITLTPAAMPAVPAEAAVVLRAGAAALPARTDEELRSPAAQRELRDLVRASAPIEFDVLLADIEVCLEKPPYIAYVTGLRFDDTNHLFLALGAALGEVVDPYHRPGSALVRRLSPARDRLVQGGTDVLSEALHTDGTDSPEPNDITCLVCVRPDQNGGGRTRLLDAEGIRTHVFPRLDAGTVRILTTEAMPWRIAEALGGGTVPAPVLAGEELRWLRQGVDPSVPPRTARALREFERALAATTEVVEFAMARNSLLVMNNRRTLHARTGVPDRGRSRRLVLRTKVFRRGPGEGA
ncbi:TauD/TfdA family dioxygenase [Actinoplanes sp. NPDC049599]|uniref:TauD/TfdA family dioxygenase n=1 Tax=Actinoplanes sp. NPDC049599 TaxID=3363903 RepID=UPI003797FF65